MDEKTKVILEMPVGFLLHIATHGNMGTGEFSDLMRTWAQRKCDELELGEELKRMQLEKLDQLRKGIVGVLGQDAMEFIDSGINTAKKALAIATVMDKPNASSN